MPEFGGISENWLRTGSFFFFVSLLVCRLRFFPPRGDDWFGRGLDRDLSGGGTPCDELS